MTPFLDEGTRLSNFNGTVAGDASCVVSRQPTKKFNDSSSSSSSTSLVQFELMFELPTNYRTMQRTRCTTTNHELCYSLV
jgi:hypothetical protein